MVPGGQREHTKYSVSLSVFSCEQIRTLLLLDIFNRPMLNDFDQDPYSIKENVLLVRRGCG